MHGPEIILARHGETDWSRTMKHTGRTEIPLTDEGRRQARALAGPLSQREFGRVLVSPLGRALETCELAGFGKRAERREELLEFDYGGYEGTTTKEIREDVPGWTVWTHGSKGGESPADVGARLDPLIVELREVEADVAVFAHGHVLRVLAARWIGLRPEQGASFALGTGTLSTLGWERETPVVRAWNAPV
jgi:broad specificity phosphatase PhoE